MVPLAALAATVLAGLSTLHVYWAVGGRWGHGATIPERHGRPPFEPGFLATLLVAGLLGPVAPLRRLTHIGAWIIAAVFLLRGVGDFRLIGVFRAVGGMRFASWDRRLYTPLALAVGICTGIMAASTP